MSPENKNQQRYSASYSQMAGILALLIWSSTAIANKIAVAYMDGLSAGVLRSLLAGILAVVIVFCLKFPFPRSSHDRILLSVSGVFSFSLWPMLMSVGIEHTSIGHAALIMTLIPVFTALFGAIAESKSLKAGWWLGAVVAVVSTAALIFFKHDFTATSPTTATIKGDIIILIGGMMCAVGYVAGGRLSPKIGTSATTFWGLSIALIVLCPVFFSISGDTDWAKVTSEGWYAIAWMTLLSSLAGYALWYFALGHGGIGRIGSLLFLMPVITLVLAHLILNERVTIFMLIICACIIFGTFFAQKSIQTGAMGRK